MGRRIIAVAVMWVVVSACTNTGETRMRSHSLHEPESLEKLAVASKVDGMYRATGVLAKGFHGLYFFLNENVATLDPLGFSVSKYCVVVKRRKLRDRVLDTLDDLENVEITTILTESKGSMDCPAGEIALVSVDKR